MRSLLLLIALLAACSKPPPPPPPEASPVATLDAIRARGVLRVGTENHSPPMYFLAEGGRPDGFEHRIIQALAEELGVKAEILPVTTAGHVPAVRSGAVDIVVSGWLPADSVGMAWSTSYLESGLCLVVAKGSPIRRVSALAGKKVGLYTDPAAEAWAAEALRASTITPLEDGYFDLLAAGEIDALIYDYPFVIREIAAHADDARVVQLNLHPYGYAAMLPPDDPALKEAVDAAITAVRARPEYRGWIREFMSVDGDMARILDLDPPERKPGARVHAVQEGETLRSIAVATYGDEERWKELWRANKDVVALPELLAPGSTLVLP
jgi:ABC-type amino acid transport substrate-binding protein